MGGILMFRKMLISAIIVTAVFAAGSAVYAQSGTNYAKEDAPVFKLLSDNESKTFDREYMISGSASEGTVVTIELYWFKSEKSIIVNKKQSNSSESEGDWIFQDSKEYTVGSSGIFAEPVALNLGKNKIVLLISNADGETEEITLELVRSLEKDAKEEVNGPSLNKFVEDLSSKVNSTE
jgi:hypothetical protein